MSQLTFQEESIQSAALHQKFRDLCLSMEWGRGRGVNGGVKDSVWGGIWKSVSDSPKEASI